MLRFCRYYVHAILVIVLIGILIVLFTDYGDGNYCYLTDALLIGFECHNFKYANFFEVILNLPLWLILISFLGRSHWIFLLVSLLLWLPFIVYGFGLFRRFQARSGSKV